MTGCFSRPTTKSFLYPVKLNFGVEKIVLQLATIKINPFAVLYANLKFEKPTQCEKRMRKRNVATR